MVSGAWKQIIGRNDLLNGVSTANIASHALWCDWHQKYTSAYTAGGAWGSNIRTLVTATLFDRFHPHDSQGLPQDLRTRCEGGLLFHSAPAWMTIPFSEPSPSADGTIRVIYTSATALYPSGFVGWLRSAWSAHIPATSGTRVWYWLAMAEYFSFQFASDAAPVHAIAASQTHATVAAAIGEQVCFFDDQVRDKTGSLGVFSPTRPTYTGREDSSAPGEKIKEMFKAGLESYAPRPCRCLGRWYAACNFANCRNSNGSSTSRFPTQELCQACEPKTIVFLTTEAYIQCLSRCSSGTQMAHVLYLATA